MARTQNRNNAFTKNTMPVCSIRLPQGMWQRLEMVLTEVNQRRVRRVGMSSVIRALLERGLDDPGQALEFGAKAYRPDRVKKRQAERRAAAQAEQEAPKMYEQVTHLVESLKLTPAAFAQALGGDRHDAEDFYHRGVLPDGDAVTFVTRVRGWLSRTG